MALPLIAAPQRQLSVVSAPVRMDPSLPVNYDSPAAICQLVLGAHPVKPWEQKKRAYEQCMAIPTAVGSVSCLIPPKNRLGLDQWQRDFTDCMKMPGARAIEKLESGNTVECGW